jgi:ribose transport system substrate-binding protein
MPRLLSAPRTGAALIAVLCTSLTLAACGDDSDSGSSGAATSTASSAGAADPVVAEAQKALDAASGPEGTFTSPPEGSGTAPKGKSIVVILFGQGIPSFAAAVKQVQAAGEKLDWNVRVVDGKFSSNAWLAGIRDAINAKADGVITFGPDCPPIKAALQQAKAAKIPVINVEGHDCDTLEPGAEPEFAATVGYHEGTLVDWLTAIAKLQAQWAIVHTDGKAKVLDIFETDAHTFKVMNDAFREELAKCKGCSIVDQITLTGADYGPKLQQKTQQALLKNPDTNVVWPGGTETLLPAGVAAAVRSSQSKPVSVGWECQDDSKTNFKNGILGVCFNYTPQWEAYAAVDALISIFAGKEPTTDSGMGLRLVDAEHNQDYVPYQSPVDFEAPYEKAWGVG